MTVAVIVSLPAGEAELSPKQLATFYAECVMADQIVEVNMAATRSYCVIASRPNSGISVAIYGDEDEAVALAQRPDFTLARFVHDAIPLAHLVHDLVRRIQDPDTHLLNLAQARLAADDGARFALDDVAAEFGVELPEA